MANSPPARFSDDEFAGLFWILGELEARARELFAPLGGEPVPGKAELEALFLRMRESAPPQASPFSADFSRRLSLGKYTRWAVALTQGGLADLLARLEELRPRLAGLQALINQHPPFTPWTDENQIRGWVALEALVRFIVRGERYGREEAPRLITSGMQEWMDAAYRAIPDEIIAAAERAAPTTRWRRFGQSEEGRMLAGTDSEDRWNVVLVRHDGGTTVTSVRKDGPPHAILAALGTRPPEGSKLFGTFAIGPDIRIVQSYQLNYLLASGEIRSFFVSADGKDVREGDK